MNANPEPQGPVQASFDEDAYEDDGFTDTLPVRPRRPFLTKWTAGLMALVLAGVGFYIGVRVEKGKIPSTGGTGASAFTRALSGAAGSGTKGTSNSSFASRFGGAGGLAGGFGGAGANATAGSVSSVSGNTLYVTETSGDTVKVKLSGQTTITKTESVAKSKVYPGDEVVIEGAKGSGGTVTATSVTDSGARSTGTGSTSSTGGSSASSAISSLFGGG